jgi:hypothetical protein
MMPESKCHKNPSILKLKKVCGLNSPENPIKRNWCSPKNGSNQRAQVAIWGLGNKRAI